MNIIELDFISIVIGYMVGVALMWSLTQTVFYKENEDDKKAKSNDENSKHSVYHWNYPYNNFTPE